MLLQGCLLKPEDVDKGEVEFPKALLSCVISFKMTLTCCYPSCRILLHILSYRLYIYFVLHQTCFGDHNKWTKAQQLIAIDNVSKHLNN